MKVFQLLVLSLLLFPSFLWAAIITSNATVGDWPDSGSWVGGVVPGNGDQVIFADGSIITVPFGYTAIIGTSPDNDSGAVALQCASASGTGRLIVNGTLVWKGPVRQANATWTVNAGGVLTYDSTGATSPAAALYTWQIGQGNSQANAKLVFNGNSGSRATVNSQDNYQSGGFGNTGTGWINGGRVEAAFTDFSYQGPATTTGAILKSRLASSVGMVIFDHCTLSNCGQIHATSLSGDSTFSITNTKISSPANTGYSVQVNATTARTTGTRLIRNNDIAGMVYVLCIGAVNSGFTHEKNIHRVNSASSPAVGPVNYTSGGGIAAWDQNLIFLNGPTTADPAITLGFGNFLNTYLFRQCNPNHTNAHTIYTSLDGGNLSFEGWVMQYFGSDTNSDYIILPRDPTLDRNLTVNHTIFLPNSAGLAVGSFVNRLGVDTQDNAKIYFEHNTCAGGCTMGDLVFGVGAEAGAVWPPGAVPSIQSNMIFRLNSGTGLIANSSSSATVNNGAVVSADYNGVFNITGSIYGSPSGQFSTTPGMHDVSADPQFTDASRSILNFDQRYLGQPVASGWADGTSYVVGNVVSASTATFFGGATFNFRCIEAHASATADNKPGSGTTWARYWEPAAVQAVSDSIIAGDTFSGGVNSMIGELVSWVKAGFAPTNPALKTAGYGGTYIGAMDVASTGNTAAALLMVQ